MTGSSTSAAATAGTGGGCSRSGRGERTLRDQLSLMEAAVTRGGTTRFG